MDIFIRVCGWQELKTAADSGDNIPATRTLRVESGTTRSKEYTIGPYSTTSTKYPSWHTDAGKEICPITQWRLSSTTGSFTAYAAALNTASSYVQLLRSWDVATQKFLIDTADDTSQLGTETFYIEI